MSTFATFRKRQCLRRSSQSCRLKRASRPRSPFPPTPFFLPFLPCASRQSLPDPLWRPDTHHSAIQKPTGLAAETCSLSWTSLLRVDSGSVTCVTVIACSSPSPLSPVRARPVSRVFGSDSAPPTRPHLPGVPFQEARILCPVGWRSTRLRKVVAQQQRGRRRWTRP